MLKHLDCWHIQVALNTDHCLWNKMKVTKLNLNILDLYCAKEILISKRPGYGTSLFKFPRRISFLSSKKTLIWFFDLVITLFMILNLAHIQVKKKLKKKNWKLWLDIYLEPVFQFSNALIVQELWLTSLYCLCPSAVFYLHWFKFFDFN